MLSAALVSQSCLSAILSGIARNKKHDEGKIQNAITKYMKDKNYRWSNYHPAEGDEAEEDVDDVPLVSGDTHPSSPLVTCWQESCWMSRVFFEVGTCYLREGLGRCGGARALFGSSVAQACGSRVAETCVSSSSAYCMYGNTRRFLTSEAISFSHHSISSLPLAYISTQCASKAAWVQ